MFSLILSIFNTNVICIENASYKQKRFMLVKNIFDFVFYQMCGILEESPSKDVDIKIQVLNVYLHRIFASTFRNTHFLWNFVCAYCLSSGSFLFNFSSTFISSLAASLYFSIFFIIFNATTLSFFLKKLTK